METVDEALKKGPRLCWAWNNGGTVRLTVISRVHTLAYGAWKQYVAQDGCGYEHAELVSRREIEPFLGNE